MATNGKWHFLCACRVFLSKEGKCWEEGESWGEVGGKALNARRGLVT